MNNCHDRGARAEARFSVRECCRPRCTETRLAVTLALGLALLAGCQNTSRLELTSFNDPYFPEKYMLKPATCVYRYDASGDCNILASSTDAIGSQAAATRQWLHIHIYWKPRPGKTHDNPTSMDATVRYAVATARGVTLYSGVAFVYPSQPAGGRDLKISIESGQLHAAPHSDAPDLLGETRLAGTLWAHIDASAALDLQRQLDLAVGAGEGAR